MQIYNVYQSGKRLYIDEKENPDNKIACNKYESEQTTLRLVSDGTLPPRLYWALRNPKLSQKYFILKLVNNEDLIVGTDISAYAGLWDMLLIGTDEDYIIEGTDIDQSKLTYVSDHFGRLFVRDNFLEELDFEEQTSPTFRVFYDEIMFQLGNKADKKDIPDKMSDLENDTNFISGVALKDDGEGNVSIIGTTFSGGETEEGEIPSGGDIEVDDKLDEESTNPVQNKVVAKEVNSLKEKDESLDKEVKTLRERNAKLEETVEKLQIKTTTSPSPFHHITDGANMKVLDFGMEGKTEQETTSGKNLFDINGDINQYYPGTIMSTNSNVLNDDGTITVNTSTSASVGCGFKVEGIAGKTLTISFDVVSVGTGTGVSSSICIPTQMNYDIKSNISAGKKLVLTKTFGEDINEAIFTFITQSGTGGIIKNVQIELNSTATDYEPYTNGPSPNPDYPQEIVNAGVYNEATGRYEIGCSVGNKNWYTGGDVEFTGSNKTIKLNRPLPIGTYYISALVSSTDTDDTRCLIVPRGCTGSGAYLTRSAPQRTSSYFTLTSECTIITFYPSNNNGNSAGDSATFKDIQIELLEATDYTPHASQQFTLTSPVPLTKWDYKTKRDGLHGWSIWNREYIFDKDKNYTVGTWGDLVSFSIYVAPLIGSRNDAFCESFRFISNPQTLSPQQEGLDWHGTTLILWLHKDRGILDVESFKAYLTENPIKIQYHSSEEQAFHPLPDEEQELLKNLETYYGVTNVYNDQGCPMWFCYTCDSKLYVDQKLEQINNALLSLGANV